MILENEIKQVVKLGMFLAVVQINFEPFFILKNIFFRNSKGFDKCSKNWIAKIVSKFLIEKFNFFF